MIPISAENSLEERLKSSFQVRMKLGYLLGKDQTNKYLKGSLRKHIGPVINIQLYTGEIEFWKLDVILFDKQKL